ncbi:hypothetical protein NTE_03182 [Candidatus Nitrososphaera evergladensis SR1]|uniref:Uncharacterized protein n=1 Tax=Candidatus Nitrososphaera evergladensis SR1 TaxID=1459636 RepID=A0A075MX62_9ARCH|nr:hypothetical protein NTE_03182 [Candidatus Nitrososphaera evergladensis SR1]
MVVFADPFPFHVAKPVDLDIVLLYFAASAHFARRENPYVIEIADHD